MVETKELLSNELEVYSQSFCDSTDTIVITDILGNIAVANQAWLDLYGYTLDEVLGKSMRIIRSDNTGDDVYTQMWKQIGDANKGFWNGELINRKKNGDEVPIMLTITPIRRDGKMIGYMGIGIDLTPQKQFEKFRELYNLVIRHDLQSPLNSILSMLKVLMGGYLGPITPKQENMLERLIIQARRMQEMIATSLDVEKLKRKKLNLDRKETDLVSLTHVSFETFREKSEAKNLALKLIVNNSEPGPAETYIRSIDPVHMQRCMDNLVHNAIDGSFNNEQITVSIDSEENSTIIRIHNKGKPIPADVRDTLFHPFSTYGKRCGTGLGLYGVKLTMEAMGGTVNYESGETGTTFELRIPDG